MPFQPYLCLTLNATTLVRPISTPLIGLCGISLWIPTLWYIWLQQISHQTLILVLRVQPMASWILLGDKRLRFPEWPWTFLDSEEFRNQSQHISCLD